jgi:hypothetical protein
MNTLEPVIQCEYAVYLNLMNVECRVKNFECRRWSLHLKFFIRNSTFPVRHSKFASCLLMLSQNEGHYSSELYGHYNLASP